MNPPARSSLWLSLSLAASTLHPCLAASLPGSTPEDMPARTRDDSPDGGSRRHAHRLQSVQVSADSDRFGGDGHAQVNKSELPLNKTPFTVTVIPRAILDSQQALSLADALHNVPGVVAGNYGRRGWDDLIIRGQTASDSLYLDGLRTTASNRLAQQIFGLDQIEVLQGPASLLYGMVLPGGLVNMVSKRPQTEQFLNLDTTIGNYGLRQGTLDANLPLSANGKAALRINALAMHSDDQTRYVWSRNRWIAPSLSLDLGDATDFTLLASYQDRSYIRQQGLPLSGSVHVNPLGQLPRDLFTGEPDQRPYHGIQHRIGYQLTQRFGSGWILHHNLRYEDFSLDGQLVANGAVAADHATEKRTAQQQHWDGSTISEDTNLQREFDTGPFHHELTTGSDYLRSVERARSYTCTIASLNLYAPVYAGGVSCPGSPRTSTTTTIRDTGAYLRDTIQWDEQWLLLAGVRRDSASNDSINRLTAADIHTLSHATTGSTALMYEGWTLAHPYLSFATSFYPNSGTDADGSPFAPEHGRQWEAGVKFSLQQGTTVNLAIYDLRRNNVLETDPVNDGYSIAVGEERSRGAEIGFTTDFRNGLSLTGGYAYTQAIIADDGGQIPSTDGQRINNVPRHSATLFARYLLPGNWSRWQINGGLRGQSKQYTYGYYLAGYFVADAGIAYEAAHWRAAFNIRNLLNQHYFAGGLKAAVATGDDRNAMFTFGLRL
ncbi:TonB-dependent receptor [Frateuria aurantia]|uniref:TonB-dependent siderophore receptor n=1 Tax=Frateuria aurantia (strain ATCC 33424 / DSM 6220 / KCTC 2777 / LMG 1558 / NBRC 3245 / NCIMB 13370) TaxID=767434 RepID=H8KYK1_FRAAD|nr:TonB-dependent siderophore receptor [Frateuria aurantia]AFC85129.1 TonB-dependent siderophore receptor [Frateuria aurantia DSM 6220]